MTAVGGSIQEFSVAGRTFTVAFDADSQRKLGGSEGEWQANGNGTGRLIKTRVNWMIDGLTASIDDDRGDQEFLQAVANGNDPVPIDITYASGLVYQGEGTVTGEFQTSSQTATGAVVLSGPGQLTKQ